MAERFEFEAGIGQPAATSPLGFWLIAQLVTSTAYTLHG